MDSAFDLVVVGSGGAGLTAAVVAHDLGARVVVVEKAARVGGTFAYSTGLVWVPNNHHMRAEGVSDSRDEVLAYVRARTAGRHDEDVLLAFVDHAPETIAYLEQRAGVPFEVVPNYPDEQADEPGGRRHGRYLASPLFPAGARLDERERRTLVLSPHYAALPVSWREIQGWGGFGSIGTWDWSLIAQRVREDQRGFGTSTAGFLYRAALDRQIPIWTETAALDLVRDGGRVAGARVSGPGGERVLHAARGVVLATGSYDNNEDFKRRLEPHPPTIPLGIPTVDGSGLVMALELGARFALLGGQLIVPAYHVPGEEADGAPLYRLLVRETAFPGGMIVNRAGRRFCDEASIPELRRRIAQLDPATRTYPNYPAYFVVDQRWKDRYPLGSVMPGEVPDWLTQGATAAELAAQIGVDPAALGQTIARFNRFAAEGEDPDYQRGATPFSRASGDPEVKPNPCLRPLEPPLYALEIRLGTAGTHAGLVVDGHGQVQHLRGGPIPGLYAAGNAAANLVGGLWYNAGLMNARGMTFGLLGARHALGCE